MQSAARTPVPAVPRLPLSVAALLLFAGCALPSGNASTSTAADPVLAGRELHSLEAAGRYRDALRLAESIAARNPDSADAYLDVGRLADRLGRRDRALTAYRRFVTLAPGEGRGHELLGWLEIEAGRPNDALASFREAARVGPARGSVQFGLGSTLLALSRREEALRAFGEAAQLEPDDANNWGAMASAADELGRGAEAVQYWDRALRTNPGYFDRRPAERHRWELAVAVHGPARADSVAVPVEGAAERTSQGARARLMGPGPTSSGSGFFVSTAGMVLTNKHVIRGCTSVRVRTDSGPSIPARVVGTDAAQDLALLASDGSAPAVAVFRSGTDVRPGDGVVAIGYPLNGLLADEVNVSVGVVNALAGMYNDREQLQMSAPVQPGSSGGPLLDESGHVVGIVVTKLNARVVAEAMGDIPQNVNFALKTSVIRAFLEANQVRYASAPSTAVVPNADVAAGARRATVLVECWR